MQQDPDYPFYDFFDNYSDSGPDAYWTDIFIYWYDQPIVIEGSLQAFFSDLNPESTSSSLCFTQLKRTQDLLEKWLNFESHSIFSAEFWIQAEDLMDLNVEYH